jgi:hypothetical protein
VCVVFGCVCVCACVCVCVWGGGLSRLLRASGDRSGAALLPLRLRRPHKLRRFCAAARPKGGSLGSHQHHRHARCTPPAAMLRGCAKQRHRWRIGGTTDVEVAALVAECCPAHCSASSGGWFSTAHAPWPASRSCSSGPEWRRHECTQWRGNWNLRWQRPPAPPVRRWHARVRVPSDTAGASWEARGCWGI